MILVSSRCEIYSLLRFINIPNHYVSKTHCSFLLQLFPLHSPCQEAGNGKDPAVNNWLGSAPGTKWWVAAPADTFIKQWFICKHILMTLSLLSFRIWCLSGTEESGFLSRGDMDPGKLKTCNFHLLLFFATTQKTCKMKPIQLVYYYNKQHRAEPF